MIIKNIIEMETIKNNNNFYSDLILYITAGLIALYIVSLIITEGRGGLLDLI